MNWAQKALATVQQFLLTGPSPKIRDPQNGERRLGSSAAGINVSDPVALTHSAFWACLALKGGLIGATPLGVFDGYGGKFHKPVTDVPLFNILHESPNADQTPTDYLEFAAISLMLRGNHYARKIKDGTRLIGLEPIRPDIVQVRRLENGSINYRWAFGGEQFDLTDEDVFHVRGFGGGPLGGLSTIGYARESVGNAIAAERAAGSLFANGVRPTGALSFDKFLSAEQREIVSGQLLDRFAGAESMGRPVVLEGGVTWTSIQMAADDAQLLESRGWSVEDVCRWFLVPPILIGHSEKQTSWGTGVEQIMLNFLKFSLLPTLRRIEQSIRKQLMTPQERARGLFAEFNMEGLLRADSAGRAAFYKDMTAIGAMTINEVRAKENLPQVEGGDVPRIQMQNVPITQASAHQLLGDGATA